MVLLPAPCFSNMHLYGNLFCHIAFLSPQLHTIYQLKENNSHRRWFLGWRVEIYCSRDLEKWTAKHHLMLCNWEEKHNSSPFSFLSCRNLHSTIKSFLLLNLLLAVFFLTWWWFYESVSAWFSLCLSVPSCAIDSPQHNRAWDAVFVRACERTNKSGCAAGCWSCKDVCMAKLLLG